MMKKIIVFVCLLNISQSYAEEASTLDRLKTLGKDGIARLQETNKLATETKVAAYQDKTYSKSIDVFCNTKTYTQGQKSIEGVACTIEYKFFARHIYSHTELAGHLSSIKSEDDCDKAIALCKAEKFSFKDTNNDMVDIFHNNKIIGTVDFSKEIIGFTSK